MAGKQGAESGSYRFGIEEEYFLSDSQSRAVVRKVDPAFVRAVQDAYPDEVQREMLQSQIEIATTVCSSMGEARTALSRLRLGLASIALEHDMLLLACGTHPTASWSRQRVTQARRYDQLLRDLQMIGRRNQFCGMHIHVEIGDEDERIDLMRRITPFLPLILALSTSSPFWQGQKTGLMGYRLAAYNELPRTGLPELFADAADYRRYVDTLVSAGAIKDASYLWWAIRPSMRHPTLELRIADSCTRLGDSLAIAALYRCLLRHLARNPTVHADLGAADRGVAIENMWRAERYGLHGGLVDGPTRRLVPVADLVETLLDRLSDDAVALGCETELAVCRTIATDGTSADMQLSVYEEARSREGSEAGGLAAVIDWIASQTRADAATLTAAAASRRGAA